MQPNVQPNAERATPAGWYHAAGDPVGTQRYWDGTAWQGQPMADRTAVTPAVAVPVTLAPTGTGLPSPAPVGPGGTTGPAAGAAAGRVAGPAAVPASTAPSWWPAWVEPMAWVVSIVKGIPLVLMLITGVSGLLFAGWADSEFERSSSEELDGFGDALELAAGYLLLAIVGIVLVFGLPLVLQVRTARRRQPIGLLIVGLVLMLPELTLVVLIRQMRATLFMMILAAQLAVVLGAAIALRNRSAV